MPKRMYMYMVISMTCFATWQSGQAKYFISSLILWQKVNLKIKSAKCFWDGVLCLDFYEQKCISMSSH